MSHHQEMTQRDRGLVVIRPAVHSDLATLLDFRMAMLAELSDPGTQPSSGVERLRDANEAWLGEHFGRGFSAWLAELDGVPVASAGLQWIEHPPRPKNPAGTEAYVLNVYTKPDARRLGLARKLVQRIVDEARAAGVRRVWLRASQYGRPLYESMGFREGSYLQFTTD
jgi:GNAT superfamily N-acetyltransferase